MKIESYTISEKHKAFVWLPPKCATNFISWVLAYFEFSSIQIDTETNKIHTIRLNQYGHFGHSTFLPPNHEELSFICAVRNPYHRVLSMFQSQFDGQLTVENFEKFINERLTFNSRGPIFNKFSEILHGRRPNYLIRTENLYEDILKIPFIRDSDLNSSGILKNFCDKKINQSYNQLNPEEYLTPRIKEHIHSLCSDHFDLFGYER
jgi:hypothetical protein